MSLYPTPVGQRIPYDRDGSAGFAFGTSVALSAVPVTGLTAMNNEAADEFVPPGANNSCVGVVFSRTWDFAGYFISQHFPPGPVETSVNTTNGQDGTWVNQGTFVDPNNGSPTAAPQYRSGITALVVAGLTGVRFTANNPGGSGGDQWIASLHLYGTPTAGTAPDTMRVWQPVNNAELTTVLDEGDVTRGTSSTQSFRIHNQSATKTAFTVTVSIEALTDTSPSQLSEYQLSADGVTYTPTLAIGNLGPGATTGVLYVRDQTSAATQLGVAACRIVAVAVSF